MNSLKTLSALLISLILIGCAQAPKEAENESQRITTEQVSNLIGKKLSLDGNYISLANDGTFAGTWEGSPIAGTWK